MILEVIIVFLGVLGVLNTIIWFKAYKWGLKSLQSLGDPSPKPMRGEPLVSIVVPARNEAENISLLLNSILEQDYGNFEVIVVDDNSSDNTPKIVLEYAKRDRRIKLVRNNQSPPPGWSPKVYALMRGLEHVNPETRILVFLDADTRLLARNTLRILISNAQSTRGIVSLNPRFKCPTRRCKIAETILTTFAHCFLGFNRVLDEKHKLAWFYGCCWAVSRETYEKLGTHYAVRHSLVEDRDLAERAKSMRIPLMVIRAWDLIETIWYPRIHDSVRMLARVMRRHAKSKARTVGEALIIALSYLLPVMNTVLGIVSYNIIPVVVGLTNYAVLTVAHSIGTRINNYSIIYALTTPVAGLIMSWGLIEAARTSHIVWRDRLITTS